MLSKIIPPSKNTSRLSYCNGRNVTTSKRKRKFYNYSWMLLGLSLGLSYCSISHQWPVLQIRAGQRSIMPIPCLLPPIPTMQWSLWLVAFPRNLFLLLLFPVPEIILNILNLFSWNLKPFTKHKEQVCFLFICSFFTHCFVIILCINVIHLFELFHCMQAHSACCFAITLCNNILHIFYLGRFTKTNPKMDFLCHLSSMLIFQMKLKFS